MHSTARTLRRRGPLAAALGLTSALAGCACLPDFSAMFCGSTETTVSAFDPDDGSQRWSYEFDSRDVHTTVGSDIAVVTEPDRVSAYDAETGARRWDVDLPGSWTPSVVDDLVVLTTPHGAMVALDADDGSVRWRFGTPPTRVRTSTADEDDCPPRTFISGYESARVAALDAGDVLVVASGFGLVGIDRSTGEMVWRHEDRRFVSAVLAEGVVVAMRDHGTAVGYDPADGTELWVAPLAPDTVEDMLIDGGRLASSTMLAADGVGVVVGFIEAPDPSVLEQQDVNGEVPEGTPPSTRMPTLLDVTSFVAALDAQTGEIRWRVDTQVVPQVAADPISRTVAVEFALLDAVTGVPVGIMASDELIGGPGFYVSTDRSELTLMETTNGAVRWVVELPTAPVHVAVSTNVILVETE